MLSDAETSKLKGFAGRVGMTQAASLLGIHKTSLILILAGGDIKPNTEAVIRAALANGVTDSTTARGETKANQPHTKRRA